MTLQQVMGSVLTEFCSCMFEELHDCFTNGLAGDNETALRALSRRAIVVKDRVLGNWKRHVQAGLAGSVNGFLCPSWRRSS